MNEVDVYVFPLDCPVQKAVDLKQFLAAQKSIEMLEQEEKDTEYGEGYKRMLRERATACRVIINKIREKYKAAE